MPTDVAGYISRGYGASPTLHIDDDSMGARPLDITRAPHLVFISRMQAQVCLRRHASLWRLLIDDYHDDKRAYTRRHEMRLLDFSPAF